MSVIWNDLITRVLQTGSMPSEAVLVSMETRETMASALPMLRAAVERQGYKLRFRTLSEPVVKVALWVVRDEGSGL